jgi:hypothetical protein
MEAFRAQHQGGKQRLASGRAFRDAKESRFVVRPSGFTFYSGGQAGIHFSCRAGSAFFFHFE